MNSQFVTVEISNNVFAELMKIAEERRVAVRVVAADIIENYTKRMKSLELWVEVNKDLLPSKEQEDSSVGGIEKFFVDKFFEGVKELENLKEIKNKH